MRSIEWIVALYEVASCLCEIRDVKCLLTANDFLLLQLFKLLSVCCITLLKSFYPLQKCPFELDTVKDWKMADPRDDPELNHHLTRHFFRSGNEKKSQDAR